MAIPSPTFEGLKKSLAAHKYAPVYLLHGEEGYYIDALVREFEKILPEDEKAFNEYILYAPETEPSTVMETCYRVPMMSEQQVVILKEGQAIRVDRLAKLSAYCANPSPSTVFVICSRGAEVRNKTLTDAIIKGGGVIFESKKVYESQIPRLLDEYVRTCGLSIDGKAAGMMAEHIGTDLSRLYNEVDKLAVILPAGAAVTPEVVERHIGVSKDYNVYELLDAIAAKQAAKVFKIVAYMRANPKAMPTVMISVSIFGLFADLLIAYYTPDKSESSLMAALKIKKPFALKRIRTGMASYNAFQVIEIIDAIRAFDVASKGVGSRQADHQLFYDLMFRILTASGKLPV